MRKSPREELLAELLMQESSHAPSADQIIGLVRRKKRIRCLRRALLATSGMILLGAIMINLDSPGKKNQNPFSRVVSHAPNPNVASVLRVERISDEELLDMLGDQPAALVEVPNGERRLLLISGR